MSDYNQQYGRDGEDLAKAFLERKGYTWVASNFSTRMGEVDLIMKHKTALVFVEVKRRQHDHFGEPEEAVTKTKRAHMIKCALAYLQDKNLQSQMVRFDVVSIGPRGTRHYPNAFYAGHNYYY
jgi:putative endonuclease